MGKPYTITITNGEGKSNILSGDYDVSVTSVGYDSSSITPNKVTITKDVSKYDFTISASGTLTIHVSDGNGINIVGATFIRCDSNGTQYGSVVTTDEQGNAILSNVPYSAQTGVQVPVIYFKQLTSDGEHEFSKELLNITMNSQTYTHEVVNSAAAEKTITLKDANYAGLVIGEATMILS